MALGKLRYEPATPHLVRMLKDSREDVRNAVARALGDIQSPEAVGPLAELLHSAEWGVRRSGVDALARIPTPAAATNLVRALADDTETVAMAAGLGLSRRPQDGIPLLLAAARDARTSVRRAATYGLTRSGTPALPALRDLLKDSDPVIRLQAATGADKLAGTSAVASYAPLLRDHDAAVREGVAELAAKAGAAAAPYLAAAARDTNVAVQIVAVEALGNLNSPLAVAPLLAASGDRQEKVAESARKALERLAWGEGFAQALIVALDDRDPGVRLRALTALEERATSNAVPRVTSLLKDDDARIRALAVRLLSRFVTAANASVLEPLLADKDFAVRQDAASTLVRVGNKKGLDVLLEALRRQTDPKADDRPDERQVLLAIKWLGEGRDARAGDHLLTLAKSDQREFAVPAIAALGHIRETRAVDMLLGLVASDYRPIRNTAAAALGEIGDPRAFEPMMALFQKGWTTLANAKEGSTSKDVDTDSLQMGIVALGSLGDRRAVEPLLPLLKYVADADDPKGPGRWAGSFAIATVEALGKLKDPRTFDPIVERIRLSQQNENRYERFLRGRAVHALLSIDRARAIESLMELVKTEPGHCVEQIAEYSTILAKSGDPRAIASFVELLRADLFETRKAAVDGIRQFGDVGREELIRLFDKVGPGRASLISAALAELSAGSLDPLTAALNNPSPKVRQGVAWSLGQVSDPRAVDALIPVLKDADPAVRGAAAWALGQTRSAKALDPLLATLKDADPQPATGAAEALGALGDARAVSALAESFSHTNATVRAMAARAVGRLGDSSAMGKLLPLLEDRSPDVRTAAAEARNALSRPATASSKDPRPQ
jgi:HEAT repeat protein